jgi:hypothetical protein
MKLSQQIGFVTRPESAKPAGRVIFAETEEGKIAVKRYRYRGKYLYEIKRGNGRYGKAIHGKKVARNTVRIAKWANRITGDPVTVSSLVAAFRLLMNQPASFNEEVWL